MTNVHVSIPPLLEQAKQLLPEWRTAVARGRAWLARQADESPEVRSPDADTRWLGKLPWALAATGDRSRAIRLLRQAQRNLLEKGRLHHRSADPPPTPIPYNLGWMVTGARYSEALEPARLFYQELNRYICPEFGGIFKVPVEEKEEETYFDASIQGAVLSACLAMGDLEAARRAGDLMVRLADEQPRAEAAVYLLYHPRLGYFTDIKGDNRDLQVLSRDQPKQRFANIGFVLQGFTRLTDATGDEKYRDAGTQLLDVLREGNSDIIDYSNNHKVGFAAVMLFRQTGRPDLLETTISIANHVAEKIYPDGWAWADLIFPDSMASQNYMATIATTCDSVLWLHQICDEIEGNSDLGAEHIVHT